jgi:hypothetical protein
MNYKLIIIAVLMVIGGLVVLYRHWDSPNGEDEKTFFLTKKQIRNHSLVGAYSSIIIGIFILLYIILS